MTTSFSTLMAAYVISVPSGAMSKRPRGLIGSNHVSTPGVTERALALLDTWGDDRIVIDEPQRTAEVSDAIFSQYIVPFEAVSVLLLAALIGAIVVARKD